MWTLNVGDTDLGRLPKRIGWESDCSRALIRCCECHPVLSSKMLMYILPACLVDMTSENMLSFPCDNRTKGVCDEAVLLIYGVVFRTKMEGQPLMKEQDLILGLR